jgi:thiamine biosynthesis lipoprotein
MTALLARAAFPALGTGAVVLVTEAEALPQVVEVVRQEVAAIDLACSRFRPDSELERLNGSAGRPVPVGPLLLEAIDVALGAARTTDGDVDPTVGRALRALGYDRDFGSVERRGAPLAPPARFRILTGWRHVRLDRHAGTVELPVGMRLDLGATAKALAADRAAARAASLAGCSVLVSLGGDVAVAGSAPEGGWSIRIAEWHGADPDERGPSVSIADGGLATSSTTVRTWQRGQDRLHHVINPSTGWSADVVWRTVSVAASTCVGANVASTASIIRGERAPHWLAELGLPARLVRADGSVLLVGGWPDEREATQEVTT